MPVSFLNPALLFGAAAAALPIIIHFLSRRRVQQQPFSDLRFLTQVQARQARNLGLRRWLLLLLRVLALLCIALAVAGPRWGKVAGGGAGNRSVLFIIDASASMETQLADGTRFDAAVAACMDMIQTLPASARVQVLLASDQTTPLFDDWLPAGIGAAQGVQTATGTDGRFDLPVALRQAAHQVARAPGTPVEILLLSDLQQTPRPEDLAAAVADLQAAGDTHLLVQRLGETVPGGGVLAIQLPKRAVRPGENVSIICTVLPEYDQQVFQLELDDVVVAEAVAEIAASSQPGQPVELVFPLTVPPAGLHRGLVRKDSDAFPIDDTRAFVLDVPPSIDVLLVHGQDRPVDPAAGRGGWRYLAEALAPGDDVDTQFKVTATSGEDLTSGALQRSSLVFFVDPDPLGRQVRRTFTSWLKQGGGAGFLVGDPTLQAYLTGAILPELDLPEAADWRSGDVGRERSRVVDRQHPIFAGLDDAAIETLQEIRWSRYFQIDEGDASAALVLASDAPALITGQVGKGRFALLPWHLSPTATNLANSPMALPLFQRLAAWLAQPTGTTTALNIQVGTVPSLRVPNHQSGQIDLDRAEDLVFTGQNGTDVRTATLTWAADQPVLTGSVVDRAGFVYCLAGTDTMGLVAITTDPQESETQLLTAQTWMAPLAEVGLDLVADLTDISADAFVDALAGLDLTPWLLALAVLLLLVESVFSRGISRS